MATDAFEMALVHRVFRRELAHAPDLIRIVAAGDTKRSKVISAHLCNIVSALHHHHAAEDDLLWPMLRARLPLHAEDVTRMQEEHTAIAESIEQVAAIATRWAATANPELAEDLIGVVNELSADVDAHLNDEEQQIVPLIDAHITADEWQECLDRGAEFLTPRNVRFALAFGGFVLEDASTEERRRFIAGLPLPPRILLQLFGRRISAAYRARLYGAPGSP